MNERLFVGIFKNISIFGAIVSFLVGLDLLFGARVICALRKILDKMFNIDQSIIRILAGVRKGLDRGLYIDDAIIKTKIRVILGAILLLLSILIILLIARTP